MTRFTALNLTTGERLSGRCDCLAAFLVKLCAYAGDGTYAIAAGTRLAGTYTVR